MSRTKSAPRRLRATGPVPSSSVGSWITARFATYGRACLVGCMLAAPVVFYHRRGSILWSTPKLSVLWLGVLGALVLWGFSAAERSTWPPVGPTMIAAGACVSAAGVATAFSLSPRLSLVGLSERYGGFVPLVLYVGAMAAVIGLFWEAPGRLRIIMGAIGAGGVAGSVAVLLQEAGLDRTLWPGPVPGTAWDYPTGLMGHSNFAGAHLGMAAPCLWYLVTSSQRRAVRVAVGAGFGIDVLGLWFTRSRGGIFAAAVGLVAMALAGRPGVGKPAKTALAAAAATVLAAGLAVGVHPGRDAPPERLLGIEAFRTKTLDLRLASWAAALRSFADHPVVGTGPDTFYAYYPLHRLGSDDQYGLDKPHNVLLERASDSGVLGLSTYLLVVGFAQVHGIRQRRKADAPERALLAAFVGLLCAYLAQSLVSIDLPSLAVTGWVAIGGIAVLADPAVLRSRQLRPSSEGRRRPPRRGHERSLSRPPFRRALLLGVVPVLGAAAVIGIAPLRAALAAQDGRYDRAIALDPFNTDARVAAAQRAYVAGDASADAGDKQRLLDEARRRYMDSLSLVPRDLRALVGLAEVETSWASGLDPSHFRDAERWWDRAISLDPRNQPLRHAHDRRLGSAVRATVARLEAESKVRPGVARTHADLAYAYIAQGETAKAREAAAEAVRLDPADTRASSVLAGLP